LKVSLIVTTYNWKEALELVLLSAFRQSRLPDEILVADDGSREDTRDLVLSMEAQSPVPLHHVWQEDRGFRAAAIRNKAIAKTTGNYLLLIDGDIILHPDFVHDHCRAARPHSFIQGSRVLLGQAKTAQVMACRQLHFSYLESGLANRKNGLRWQFLSGLCARRRRSLTGIRTCNFAVWRDDVLRVNGFNEEFVGWGREDSEFAVRLMNSGIARRNLRFGGVGYHLFHPEHPRSDLARNDEMLRQARESRSTRCEKGLDCHFLPEIP
jgi:glycosyltransferase involved in cell wall biosynthesis